MEQGTVRLFSPLLVSKVTLTQNAIILFTKIVVALSIASPSRVEALIG